MYRGIVIYKNIALSNEQVQTEYLHFGWHSSRSSRALYNNVLGKYCVSNLFTDKLHRNRLGLNYH